jgi:4-hydroxymandelate oxidase
MSGPGAFLTLEELEQGAAELLSPEVRTFVGGGAGAGSSIAANAAAWRRFAVQPRVLVDVSACSTATTVLGADVELPVLVAPSGLHTLVDPAGEVATAEGARRAGTIMVLSHGTGRSIEDVAATGAALWLQTYWGRDRDQLRSLVDAAVASGFGALCVTVDLPVRPLIERPMAEALAKLGSVKPLYMLPRSAHLDPSTGWDHDASLTWRDLAWLREICPLPILLKGIMSAADAEQAVAAGVDAIIVSNHGGRALDNGVATADVLPEVVDAVEGRIEVLVDGGIRHGRDVFVALALGAKAVLVGRPALWGLAVGRSDGVADVLALLRHQFGTLLAQAGVRSPAEIDSGCIRRL